MYIFASDPHGTGQPWIDKIEKMKARYPDAITVFGGDYIDGRKFSKETVDYVMSQTHLNPAHNVALMGNHEQLLLNYLAGEYGHEGLWFYNGGKTTVRSLCGRGFGKGLVRQALATFASQEIMWITSLPDIYETAKIIFVHAGLRLNIPYPIQQTSHFDKIWLRDTYFYQEKRDEHGDPLFAHNPLPQAIVTGHTPTVLISGSFDDTQAPIKQVPGTCPILTVQYQGEFPRYFCDGGCHGTSLNTGTVAVFNDEARLVDRIKSDES